MPNIVGRWNRRDRTSTRKSVRLTVMAENMLTSTPIASVSAKPLTIPDPKYQSTEQVIRVETFESRLGVQAPLTRPTRAHGEQAPAPARGRGAQGSGPQKTEKPGGPPRCPP